jgi:flagellar basal-body rod modification protein FlgD
MTGTDNNGKLVSISTRTTGVVTGVDFTGSEPVLLVGNSRLNLSGVTSVLDPAAYTTTPDDTSDEAPDDTPDAT